MMRDDTLTQFNEFLVAYVALGIIGAPRADDEAPCAVRLEHVINSRQQREAKFVGGSALF